MILNYEDLQENYENLKRNREFISDEDYAYNLELLRDDCIKVLMELLPKS